MCEIACKYSTTGVRTYSINMCEQGTRYPPPKGTDWCKWGEDVVLVYCKQTDVVYGTPKNGSYCGGEHRKSYFKLAVGKSPMQRARALNYNKGTNSFGGHASYMYYWFVWDQVIAQEKGETTKRRVRKSA
jgi:hypothetical protein